ncbi:MAG: tail fiber domain-containing protein, partial [Bdellovibrionota bacterium]
MKNKSSKKSSSVEPKSGSKSASKPASNGARYMQTEGFISRVNQDGTVILMHLSDVSSFFKLSKLTAAIWPEFRQVRTVEGLVAHFSKLLPKHADKLKKDIPQMLESLLERKLIEVVSEKESTDFDTPSLSMEKYDVGSVQIFDLDKIETEVLNESIYLDVFAGSDMRLKTDVKPLENALAKISALDGVNYKWTAKAQKAASKKGIPAKQLRTGLIAQQVLEQMPELVRADKDSGLLAVNYTKLNAYLVEAVKELSQKVDTLEA